MIEFTAPHVDMWNAWHDWFGNSAGAGMSHVQLVLDPITTASIAEFAPVFEILDRG